MSPQAPGTVADDAPRLGAGSVVVVVALACAFCASVPFLQYRYGAADPAGGYLPFGPLVLLAIACWVIAPLARRFLGRSEKFVRGALLFYAIATTLGGFSTQFTVLQIPQVVTSLRYFATPLNAFETDVFPLIPDTLMITNEVVARGFYEGARGGGIPWDMWVGPLVRWGSLALLYLITAWAMLGMFRQRWIRHERLPFPLAEIPLFVAGHGQFGMTRDPGGTRNKLLGIGMLLVTVVHSINAVNRYIPSIPAIPLRFSFTPLFEHPPFDVLRGASWATAWVDIPLIGISYLMPSAMALGVFGFFLLLLGVMVLSRFLGDPTLGPLNFNRWGSQKDHQAGAYLGLLVFVLWTSRADLAEMGRGLWRQVSGTSTGKEHPDRWMPVIFVAGMLGLCWWCVSAGVSFLAALAFMIAALALTFGFAMLTAQTGLPALQTDNLPAQFLTGFVPAKTIGLQSLGLLGFFNTMFSWYKRHALQPCAMQALKIADTERFRDRVMLPAVFIGGAIVIALNLSGMLYLAYNEGLMIRTAARWHQHSGGMGSPHYGIIWAQRMVAQEAPALTWHWMLMGAVSMWVFQSLYRHFVWWPVHPLGMLIPAGWQITAQWFSVMVGWALGRLVAKYAGPRVYLQLRPMFLGLVLGGAAAQAIWMVIDVMMGMHV